MLALATTSIAWVILTIITVGWVVYYFLNRGAARPELGAEVELAPNRKPYYDDETLEGPRLERMQILGVLILVTMVIGLPLYWAFEPWRQAGATAQKQNRYEYWGGLLYATTEEGGFNCAGCHGANGGGGNAPYALLDPTTGEVSQVNWNAPAINTVYYKFSRSEVRFILEYGRPFSPMSAWGTAGGGPMNSQQIDTLLAKLESIQIDPQSCVGDKLWKRDNAAAVEICDGGQLPDAKRAEVQAAIDAYLTANPGASEGEAIFNLTLDSGAYSCARCHTSGWSYGQPGPTAQGAYGWNLTSGSTAAKFPTAESMEEFIKGGSERGKRYGTQGLGNGNMPAFGTLLTDEQIEAVVEYVRGL
jgi:mono/diheme cytochrome c family protein